MKWEGKKMVLIWLSDDNEWWLKICILESGEMGDKMEGKMGRSGEEIRVIIQVFVEIEFR